MSGIREIIEVTQEELHKIVGEKGCIYVGATVDPVEKRANEHQSTNGYSGIMYWARTQNMKKAEDKLFDTADETGGGRHNIQRASNAQEGPGYVYAIKGRKTSE